MKKSIYREAAAVFVDNLSFGDGVTSDYRVAETEQQNVRKMGLQ